MGKGKFVNISKAKFNNNANLLNDSKDNYVKMDSKELNELVVAFQNEKDGNLKQNLKNSIYNAISPLFVRISSNYNDSVAELYFLFDKSINNFNIKRKMSFVNFFIISSQSIGVNVLKSSDAVMSFSLVQLLAMIKRSKEKMPDLNDDELYDYMKNHYNNKFSRSRFNGAIQYKQTDSIDGMAENEDFVTKLETFLNDDSEAYDFKEHNVFTFINALVDYGIKKHEIDKNSFKGTQMEKMRDVAIALYVDGLKQNVVGEMLGFAGQKTMRDGKHARGKDGKLLYQYGQAVSQIILKLYKYAKIYVNDNKGAAEALLSGEEIFNSKFKEKNSVYKPKL